MFPRQTKTFHSVYPSSLSLMLPMKRRPWPTLHSPWSHVNTDIHVLRVTYRKAVWWAVGWKWACFSTASGPPNLPLSSALPSHWAKSKNTRLWILQIMEVCQRPKMVGNNRPRSICCMSAPSIHTTDHENTRVHVLDEIKPWFQYMIIILIHVRVGIIKRQARSSFNKET